jgi:hypothetical protein
MANQHYNSDDEFEITIKVKVSDISISTYQHLSVSEQAEAIEDLKSNIGEHLKNKLTDSYGQQEIDGTFVDWFGFEVE